MLGRKISNEYIDVILRHIQSFYSDLDKKTFNDDVCVFLYLLLQNKIATFYLNLCVIFAVTIQILNI